VTIDIAQRTVLITGGTSGIGRATAVGLASAGADVVITGRDPDRARDAADHIRAEAGRDVDVMDLDLASFASIRSFAADFLRRRERLDVLIANAGLCLFGGRSLTDDGFEAMFGVNHLGHFLLTSLLLDRIVTSAPARIVVVSSDGYGMARHGLDWDDLQHERAYQGFEVYGHSKLCNNYFAFELARRLDGTGVTVNALHPGFVATELGRTRPEDRRRRVPAAGPAPDAAATGTKRPSDRPDLSHLPPAVSAEAGAVCSIHVASSPELEGVTGRYFRDCVPVDTGPVSADPDAARRLWEISEELVASVG
jgi:NAD(P)-dependent dehydrogenase (short-subunit alcohol dehydrogenase family)